MSSASMVLFELLTATLFLRPAELFEPLAGMPIYEALIAGCLLLSGQRLQNQLQPKALRQQPVILCALALVPAAAISHLTHAYLGGAVESSIALLKTLVYLGLLITIVDTPARLHRFLRTVALCATTMVGLCLIDFHEIVDFKFIQHLADFDGLTDEDEVLTVLRMRGTGIFEDPNDLAMVAVAAGVLCAGFFFQGRGATRFGWLGAIAMLGVAILETKSRGGLLATGVAGLVLVSFRWGVKWGIGLAAAGLMLVMAVSSRQTEINLDEGTGQERIQLWRDGFDALKSPDILFGTGYGTYSDIAPLVAHNSFIHAYVELGLFGGTLFFGCFFLLFAQLIRVGTPRCPLNSRLLLTWRPFITALLAGWCTSMLSLSRCYVVPTFLVIGLGIAYCRISSKLLAPPRPILTWNSGQMVRLAFASGATFAGFYLFTAVMAR